MDGTPGNRGFALVGAILLGTAAWGAPSGPGLIEERLDRQADVAMQAVREPGWMAAGRDQALREAVDRLLALGYHQVRNERFEAAAESFLEARFLVAEHAPHTELALRCSDALVRLRRNQGEAPLLVHALEDHRDLHRLVRPGAMVERAGLVRELAGQYRATGDAAARRDSLREAVTLTREAEGPTSGRVASLQLDLAEALLDAGQKEEARRLFEGLRAREAGGAQAFGGTHPVVNPRILQGLAAALR